MKRLVCIGIIFIIFGCSKEENPKWTEARFTAINGITGEPVDDMYFYIYGRRTSFPKNTHNVGQKFTKDGYVAFEFMHKNRYEYQIYRETYPYYERKVTGPSLVAGEVNEYVYELVEYGLLLVTISNANCYNSSDAFECKLTYLDDPTYEIDNFYWKSGFSWDGCNHDILMYDIGVPAGNYSLEWLVLREDGSNAQGTETFWVSQSDTTIFHLDY